MKIKKTCQNQAVSVSCTCIRFEVLTAVSRKGIYCRLGCGTV
jgi:hypothetical protein